MRATASPGRGALVIRIAVPPRSRKRSSVSQAGANAATPLWMTPQTSHNSTS